MLEAKAKDSPSEDRHSQGQRQKCSRPRPRTQTQVFSKKKLFKLFSGDLKKKGLEKKFSADLQNFNYSKNTAVLKPRTGQFLMTWGFETKAKDFKMCPRGRISGLQLWK